MPKHTLALLLCLSAACRNEMVPTLELEMPGDGREAETDGSELFAASRTNVWRLDLNARDAEYWVEEWPLGPEEIRIRELFRSDRALCFSVLRFGAFCRSDGEWREEPDAVRNRGADTRVAVRLPRCFGCEEQAEAIVISDRIAVHHTSECTNRDLDGGWGLFSTTCVEWHHEFVFYDLEVSDEEGLLVPMGEFSADWGRHEYAHVADLSGRLVIWRGARVFVFADPTM